MKGTVRWIEDKTMEGITEGGKKFGIYGKDFQVQWKCYCMHMPHVRLLMLLGD